MMIDGIFALLNFGILIGFCLYIFRKYAAEPLRSYITMEQVTLTNTQRKYEQLLKQEQTLLRAGQHQLEMYQDLSRKVAAWSAALHQHNVLRTREKTILQEHIQQRLQEQMLNLEHHIICKEVLPRALEQATHQLIEQFNNQHQQDLYTKQTLTMLPKVNK